MDWQRMTDHEHSSHPAVSREIELAVERERIALLKRFMGDVSHDFRTPLTAIKLSLYLLQRAQTEADRQRHMSGITRQVDRLEQLITELFSMSRLDMAETNQFRFGRVDANEMLNSILTAHQPFIEEKQLHIRFEQGQIRHIMGDWQQLERAFGNLLTNAITYTPPGGTITLRTDVESTRLVIEIADSGIGIDTAELPHIFTRFYRGDRARGTATGGMGLGLSITLKIIEAHGGQITVESEPGKGSLFRVSFPASLSQQFVEKPT
jgi:signal transduction histidine kinase